MVTGRLPFPGHYPSAVIYAILNEEAPEPSLLVAEFTDYEDGDGGAFPRSVRVDLDAGTAVVVGVASSSPPVHAAGTTTSPATSIL